ncbi:MAG TPA: DUF1549 domain-containing protein [Acidobacteriota bacterium]
MKRKALLLMLGVLAAAFGVVIYPSQSAKGSSEDEAFADCTFYAGHKEMFLSNEARRDREYGRIAARLKKLPSAPGNATATMEPKGFIDWEIIGKLQQAGISPAPQCSDEEFVRRVYLDVTGRIPSADDVREFLASTDSEKRNRLIDQLMRTPEYADRWALFLGDLTEEVGNSNQTGVNLYNQGRNVWYDYIRQSVADNKPYSEFATDLITATTSPTVTTWENGPANYIARWRQANGPVHDTWDNLAEAVGKHFMGMSLNCISCHNGAGHTNTINLFLTQKSRYDFWGMGAYFAKISGANNSANVGAAIVQEAVVDPRNANNRLYRYRINEVPTREYTLNTNNGNKTPRTGKSNEFVKPSFILSGEAPAAGEPYRVALARHVVKNRQFARAAVNYVWKDLFGLGLVEPADNFDPARLDPNAQLPEGWDVQPTHPILLEKLADYFIDTNYNFFRLVEVILKSATYQLSTRYDGEWSDTYIPYFARKFPKRLTAEQIHDAIVKATSMPPNPLFDKEYIFYNTNVPVGSPPTWQYRVEKLAWAMQLPDTKAGNNVGESFNFLTVFLRGDRDVIPRSGESSLLQELNMFNNQFVIRRIKNNGSSTVSQLLRKNLAPVDLVNELYLATLSRRPTPSEQASGVTYMTKGTLANRVEDLQFVLLNKVDFMFNY